MTVRVLHVNAGNLYGGIESMLVTLARARGEVPALEQEFAVAFEGRFSEALRGAGARVHVLGAARVSRPWTVLRARSQLAGILARGALDAVAVHGSWSHALFGSVVRRAGPTLVHWAHAPLTGRHWLEAWARRAPPRLVIANSRFTASAVRALFPSAPVTVIHPPVPPATPLAPTERAALRRDLGAGPDDAVVLFVGRLERLKGAHVLVDALGSLATAQGWRAWIVAAPQRPEEERYLAELRAAAARAGIVERVAFLGERRDVARLFAAADVYCQPNVAPESFGMTFVEALRAGLPVVTTAIGGALEILDESCAVFVRPRASELASRIALLAGDRSIRERLGDAARVRAARFDEAPAALRGLAGTLIDLFAPGAEVVA